MTNEELEALGRAYRKHHEVWVMLCRQAENVAGTTSTLVREAERNLENLDSTCDADIGAVLLIQMGLTKRFDPTFKTTLQ